MDMTLEAFAALEPGSYVLLDIRNAQSREYGCFPGSLAMPREALEDCTLPHDGRKLIVYCARGQFSREAAEMLAKQGYEAFSLEGGYSAWLKGQMQRQQENLQEKAETSLQKSFVSRCGASLPKPFAGMRWYRKGTGSPCAFREARIPCSWPNSFSSCSFTANSPLRCAFW